MRLRVHRGALCAMLRAVHAHADAPLATCTCKGQHLPCLMKMRSILSSCFICDSLGGGIVFHLVSLENSRKAKASMCSHIQHWYKPGKSHHKSNPITKSDHTVLCVLVRSPNPLGEHIFFDSGPKLKKMVTPGTSWPQPKAKTADAYQKKQPVQDAKEFGPCHDHGQRGHDGVEHDRGPRCGDELR